MCMQQEPSGTDSQATRWTTTGRLDGAALHTLWLGSESHWLGTAGGSGNRHTDAHCVS